MSEYLSARDFKQQARLFSPYPVLLLMADGESICHPCARREARYILEECHHVASGDRWPDEQWTPVAFYEHLEGPEEYCAHCNAAIASAYGDPDADEDTE